MATIDLSITDDIESPKEIILEGTAKMFHGDTEIQVQLPEEHVSPLDRTLDITAEIKFREVVDESLPDIPSGTTQNLQILNDEEKQREVTLQGRDKMAFGFDTLELVIPTKHIAGTGRFLDVQAELTIMEVIDPESTDEIPSGTVKTVVISDDVENQRTVTMKGSDRMEPGGDIIECVIPSKHIAPSGRILDVIWEVKLEDKGA